MDFVNWRELQRSPLASIYLPKFNIGSNMHASVMKVE